MKILYIEMDNVLVDFPSGISKIPIEIQKEYEGRLEEVPHIFSKMEPIQGAIEAFNQLTEIFDTYILSAAPWENSSAWSDKLDWVKKYLGKSAHNRLILSHHINLNAGHYLVHGRIKNGVDKFKGKHVHYGSVEFPDWATVTAYLNEKITPRKYICPNCKKKAGVHILYGMPSYDAFLQSERGEIRLGGCVLMHGQPDRYCGNCEHEWRIKRKEPLFDYMVDHGDS